MKNKIIAVLITAGILVAFIIILILVASFPLFATVVSAILILCTFFTAAYLMYDMISTYLDCRGR